MDDDTSSIHAPSEVGFSTPNTVGRGPGGGTEGASSSHTPSAASNAGVTPRPAGVLFAGVPPLSKRRRGPGLVTPNACTECRKKRAKCDGHKPRCGRCKTQGVTDCLYEVPIRQSKEHLRNEIEHLRSRQRSSDQVLAALVQPQVWEDVLNRLRAGQSIDIIAEWLAEIGHSSYGAQRRDSDVHSTATLSPLSGFAGTGPGSLSAMSLGMSPVTAQGPAQGPAQGSAQGASTAWQYGGSTVGADPSLITWHADPHGGPLQTRAGSWTDNLGPDEPMERFRGVGDVLSPSIVEPAKTPITTWTDITHDSSLVQHLLALYFCWEYPTFASLSKEHFLRDFQDGLERYCSSVLVNALLALGCRFSTQPNTRENPSDPYSSGDHFFKESQRLLRAEPDHHSLTTIQALGIMSIREASCGRDSESWYYAGQSTRLAIEMGLHRLVEGGDGDETAVKSATFWGAFALDHAWSLATGSLPQCSCFPRLPPKPSIINECEASQWIPYTDDGAPLHRSCQQPSNVRSVYKCFCELSELVHQSLYMLHSPGKPLTSRDLLYMYTQYLDWYGQIPDVLRLGYNFTPAVLFAHMYYHFAILLLFRPLIKLRIVGSNVVPRDVCTQAADAIQGLLKSYSSLYTLRRTPSFVPYFVLTSSIMHLAIAASATQSQQAAAGVPDSSLDAAGAAADADADASVVNPSVAKSISQGISDLTEMAPCHHFAEQALNILCYLAKKWKIDVDIRGTLHRGAFNPASAMGIGIDNAMATAPDEPMDIDYQAHDQFSRPRTSSLNFFAPNVREEDFVSTLTKSPLSGATSNAQGPSAANMLSVPVASSSAGGGELVTTESMVAKTSDTMDNPLFWPFPMQGRPVLPDGAELKKAGFEFL